MVMEYATHEVVNQPLALVRRFVWVAAIALCSAVSAQAGVKSGKFLNAILTQTPAAVIVPHGRQLIEAEKTAAQIHGAEAFWGVGACETTRATPASTIPTP